MQGRNARERAGLFDASAQQEGGFLPNCRDSPDQFKVLPPPAASEALDPAGGRGGRPVPFPPMAARGFLRQAPTRQTQRCAPGLPCPSPYSDDSLLAAITLSIRGLRGIDEFSNGRRGGVTVAEGYVPRVGRRTGAQRSLWARFAALRRPPALCPPSPVAPGRRRGPCLRFPALSKRRWWQRSRGQFRQKHWLLHPTRVPPLPPPLSVCVWNRKGDYGLSSTIHDRVQR